MCKSLDYASVTGPTYVITNSAPACDATGGNGGTGCSDEGYKAPSANSFVQCPQAPDSRNTTYQVGMDESSL